MSTKNIAKNENASKNENAVKVNPADKPRSGRFGVTAACINRTHAKKTPELDRTLPGSTGKGKGGAVIQVGYTVKVGENLVPISYWVDKSGTSSPTCNFAGGVIHLHVLPCEMVRCPNGVPAPLVGHRNALTPSQIAAWVKEVEVWAKKSKTLRGWKPSST